VLIHIIREPERWPAFQQALRAGTIWLSAVAVAELYAGTRSRGDALLINQIATTPQRADQLITPTPGEWAQAGRLMARRIRLEGALQPRDHLADLLILLSAARLHGTVITANVRHFQAWARLAVRAGFDAVVTPYPM
jgi:predicted nucleic acid-binding protein